MVILLIGALFLVRPGGPGRTGREPALTGGLTALSASGGPNAPPTLEEVASPGARVYRFTVGSAGDETPIYFVVDEAIDI